MGVDSLEPDVFLIDPRQGKINAMGGRVEQQAKPRVPVPTRMDMAA